MIERFFGAALIAIGAMIALLSGGCTGFYLLIDFQEMSLHQLTNAGPGVLLTQLIPLVVGLPFIGLGVALCVTGYKVMRRRPR